MRPDPHKKKASRRYWAKQKSKAGAAPATTDHNKPSEPQQLGEHTHKAPPIDSQVNIQQTADAENADTSQPGDAANGDASEMQSSDEESQIPARAPYSRRKLQDNSWRYVEETEVDEEAMINARIEAAEEQKDLQAIVSQIKAKKLGTAAHKDNVYVRPREELVPMDAAERNRLLDELNAEVVYDEFTPNPSSVPAKAAIVRSDYAKINIGELAPNVVKSALPTAHKLHSQDDCANKQPLESDELDKLLDDLL
ncbi:hypothetical protein LPJ56_001192 [Coemansia sp. RSA 2599]|nr:hypothetical protein LPJ75_000769 [Coemansia sp. RSA 2598]KAJ1828298.1 hypothetical protein LPJ56_001192 [Coemansia sp. RSA 2599]